MKEHIFYFDPEKREYLLRHFDSANIAGSYFLAHVFQSPEHLLKFINSQSPSAIISQGDNSMAHCFIHHKNQIVGYNGVAKRSEISSNDIVKERRGEHEIETAYLKSLLPTSHFCIISIQTSKGLSIVTAFPGDYAPPFPNNNQSKEMFDLSVLFWKEHILLKKTI